MATPEQRFQQVQGQRRYTLISTGSPNGNKIAVMLHELGIQDDCSIVTLDVGKGETKQPWFNNLRLCPNGRVPCIIDHSAGDLAVWESGAILMYLAEQHKSPLLPTEQPARAQTLVYLLLQMAGVGPIQGQAAHFFHFAPVTDAYGMKRFQDEVKRLYGVMESVLASDGRDYIVGSQYTIADIAIFVWTGCAAYIGVNIAAYPKLQAYNKRCLARPAVISALEKGMIWPLYTKPEVSANLLKAAQGKMEAAGALGESPAGAKAV